MIGLAVEFAAPSRLWALVIIPLIGGLYVVLAGRNASNQISARLRAVVPKDPAWKRHGAVLLALASLGALILAWALPQDLKDQPRDRATIVVAIDTSWSMEAEDVSPNRLEAAQEGAKAFVDSLPARFNVALVTFAGTADLVVPPTVDRGAINRAVDALALAPSTAVGEGVYKSLDALSLVPPGAGEDAVPPAAVVLLSDGATNVGRSSAGAAEVAQERGVPVYTIAYGTDDGFVIDERGQRQTVAVDPYELSEIARLSGGKPYAAESVGDLREVYEHIRREVGTEKVLAEVTDVYAGYAIGFAVLAAVGVISLGARWP